MLASIYDKTDKGREEIATRKHQLPNKLRPLLVLIDGKQAAANLLQKVSTLGLNEDNLRELLSLELITVVGDHQPADTVSGGTAASDATDAGAEDLPSEAGAEAENPANTSPADKPNFEKYQDAYRFLNDHIKANLGLRGFALSLKVERAASLDELRELRRPFLEAVMKAKGRDTARSIRDKLDPLLFESGSNEADSELKLD